MAGAKSGAGQGKNSGGKSTFGSNISKSGSFGSTISKASSLGSSSQNTSSSKNTSSTTRTPSFFPVSTSHAPSTSKKSYETVSYSPKTGKTSSTFGIVWIPTKKRNRKKEVAYSAINYDKKNEGRSPSMYNYNFMSGDSPDFQMQKKREEEASLLIPERAKGPIASVASAGVASTIVESPLEDDDDMGDKPSKRDNEDSKEAAGDANNKDRDYLENKEPPSNKMPDKQKKSTDKVDSAFLSSTGPIKPPPPRSESTHEDEDCGIKCLYYTLQCCDCVLM